MSTRVHKLPSARPRKVARLGCLGIGATVGLVSVLVMMGAGLRGFAGAQTNSVGLVPAFIPGDYVSFNCQHSTISWGGTSFCHDQTNVQENLGSGTQNVSIKARPDSGYSFAGWTSYGDACLGSLSPCPSTSSSNPVTLWEYCGTGQKCSGNVNVSLNIFQVKFLTGYAATPSGNGWSHTLGFTVPSGTSHVLFVWAVSDSVAPNITLPSAFSVTTEVSTSDGIAFGALSAGTYSASFTANGGWVNTATMGVYVISNDTGYTYTLSSSAQVTSLTLASGATAYLGTLYTGGAYPLTTWSLTTINEETPSQNGGETNMIGQQGSNTFSLTTSAAGYGIAAVGIYPP